MRIWINQSYIDNGVRHNPWACPVALKLQALTKKDIGVSPVTVGIDNSKVFFLGPSAVQFIRKFDNGEKVKSQYVTIKDLQVSDLE